MTDVSDILGVPSTPTTPISRTPSRTKSQTKELKSPLMMNISGLLSPLSGLKEKRKVQQKVQHWGWTKFTCPARDDDMVFHHWAPSDDDNAVSVSNFDSLHQKQIKVFQYSLNEYNTLITKLPNSGEAEVNSNEKSSSLVDQYIWTKEETDHLFQLCKTYELRFVIIHDRYVSCRENGVKPTVEQMKNRYFTVAKLLLENRAAKKNQLAKIENHPIMQSSFDYSQEVKRKTQMTTMFNRPYEYEKREAEIKERLKKIEEIKKKRAEEEKKERIAQKNKEKKELEAQKKLERERKKQERLKKLEEQRLAMEENPEALNDISGASDSEVTTPVPKTPKSRASSRRKSQRVSSYMDEDNITVESVPQKLIDLDLIDEGMISSTSFSSESTVTDLSRKLKSGVHTRSDLMLACATPEVADRMEAILKDVHLTHPMPTLRIHQVIDEMRAKVSEIMELEKRVKKLEKKAAKSKVDDDFVPDDEATASGRKRKKSSSRSSRPNKKQKT